MDATAPTDQVLVSEIPGYIRAGRVAINAIIAGSGFTVTNLVVTGGVTYLTVGTELYAVGHEMVFATCLTAATLARILGGTDGQIKTFVFGDSNIDMTDGVKNNGKIYLNEPVALVTITPAIDDVLCIVNVGGDGAAEHGYWKELYRTDSVKP